MSLPPIDIPLKLPFEVPLLVHPIFVHFVVAIPIIVLLIELINLKAKKPAVSVTSLFLLTLAIIVYIGAFFTGKADGSEAFSLLTPEAKDELKFHKLLGTYLVYGTLVLFLLKIGAMAIRRAWARNIFLLFLVLFIAVLLKQGKDGGELVYEYGVNVKPVMTLQDRLDDMEFDMEDLKEDLMKAKAECESKSEKVPVSNESNATKSIEGSETNVTAPAESSDEVNESGKESNETNSSESTIPSSYRQISPPLQSGQTPVAIPTH